MSKALIVGASGYLGNYIFKQIKFESKIGTYHRTPRKNLLKLDICDKEATKKLIASFKPDVVLYAVGITNPDACERDKKYSMSVNAKALKHIVSKRIKVIYFSSDYVFDGMVGNYSEKSPPNPINTYGASKLLGESIVLNSNSQNVVIRVGGLVDSNSLSRFKNLAAEDDRFSNPVCLKDVLSAVNIIIKNNLNGLFHVAGSSVLSRYEFKQIIFLLNKSTTEKNTVPILSTNRATIAQRPKVTFLNTNKISKYGWKSQSILECMNNENGGKFFRSKRKVTVNKSDVKAILFDCIGGILTNRRWETQTILINQIDSLCGRVSNLDELNSKLKSQGIFNTDVEQSLECIIKKYTLNPPAWKKLLQWKNKYKLALVNNGLSETFRKWVSLYGFENIFDVLHNSSEIKISKYEPQFYFTTAKSLGVLPAECLLIDDDDLCIQMASDCGMKTIKAIPQNKFPLCEHDFSEIELCQILGE